MLTNKTKSLKIIYIIFLFLAVLFWDSFNDLIKALTIVNLYIWDKALNNKN